MVCFRYIVVNTLHKGDNKNDFTITATTITTTLTTTITSTNTNTTIEFITFYLSTGLCAPSLFSTCNTRYLNYI